MVRDLFLELPRLEKSRAAVNIHKITREIAYQKSHSKKVLVRNFLKKEGYTRGVVFAEIQQNYYNSI